MGNGLFVYLDSADFIDFSGGKHNAVFDDLVALKDDGKCTFVYSYLHVMETLSPNAAKYLHDRRQVGSTIKELCGKCALPFLPDYLEGEAIRQDGMWAPLGCLDDLNFDKIIREAKLELLDQLQREGRINRHVARKLKTDSGMRAWVAENGVSTSNSTSNLGFDLPQKLFYSKAARKTFKVGYELSLFDPERYSRIVFSLRNGKDPLRQLIKDRELPLFDAMKEVLEMVRSSRRELDRIEGELHDLQTTADSAGLERSPSVDTLFSRLKSERKKISSIRLDLPPPLKGADPGLLNHYTRIMLAGETPPKELSQITDIFHLYYHPACSLFRVDNRTYESFKSYEPLKNKLVRSVVDLPAVIRKH